MLYIASPEFLTSMREFMSEQNKDARELASMIGYSSRKVQQVLHGEAQCSKTFEAKFEKLKTKLLRVPRTTAAEEKLVEDFGEWIPIVCNRCEGKFQERLRSTRATKRVGYANAEGIESVPAKKSGIYEWALSSDKVVVCVGKSMREFLAEHKSNKVVVYLGKSKDLRRRVREYVYSAQSHKRKEFDNLMEHSDVGCALWFRFRLVPEADIDAAERAYLKRYSYPWNKVLNAKRE
jgi:hypothetical protein